MLWIITATSARIWPTLFTFALFICCLQSSSFGWNFFFALLLASLFHNLVEGALLGFANFLKNFWLFVTWRCQRGHQLMKHVDLVVAMIPTWSCEFIVKWKELFQVRISHLVIIQLINICLAEVNYICGERIRQYLIVHIGHLLWNTEEIVLTDVVLCVKVFVLTKRWLFERINFWE